MKKKIYAIEPSPPPPPPPKRARTNHRENRFAAIEQRDNEDFEENEQPSVRAPRIPNANQNKRNAKQPAIAAKINRRRNAVTAQRQTNRPATPPPAPSVAAAAPQSPPPPPPPVSNAILPEWRQQQIQMPCARIILPRLRRDFIENYKNVKKVSVRLDRCDAAVVSPPSSPPQSEQLITAENRREYGISGTDSESETAGSQGQCDANDANDNGGDSIIDDFTIEVALPSPPHPHTHPHHQQTPPPEPSMASIAGPSGVIHQRRQQQIPNIDSDDSDGDDEYNPYNYE